MLVSALRDISDDRIMLMRSSLREARQGTPEHLYPHTAAAIDRQLALLDAELSRREAVRNVRLMAGYDPDAPLEDALEPRRGRSSR